MTFYELRCAVVAHHWRRKRERESARNLALTSAWMTASLSRSKRLPSLKSVLAKMEPPKKLAPADEAARAADLEQGKAALAKLAQAGGLPRHPGSRKRAKNNDDAGAADGA